MDAESVPPVLRLRLGPDATLGLVELLDLSHKEARDAMILACTERFERRLVEEASGLRVQMTQFDSRVRRDIAELRADLRQDMAELRADLRQEMAHLGADLRHEMAQLGADLRREMAQLGTELRREMAAMQVSLRAEMATNRVELFKWCFLFWIGQVVAVGGMMGVLLRVMR